MKSRLATIVFVCVVAGSAASCAVKSANGPGSLPDSAAVATSSPSSPQDWASEGEVLRQMKASMNAANGSGGPEGRAGNSADFAYRTEPIDLMTPGKVVLTFGPVDKSFDYPTEPSALSIAQPPDAKFSVIFAGAPVYITRNNQRFVQVPIIIGDQAFTPYSSFTAWIY